MGAAAGGVSGFFTAGATVVGGAVAGAGVGIFYAVRERFRPARVEETAADRLSKEKIYEVNQAINEDRKEGQKLKAMIEKDVLGKCVAEFTMIGREHHIHSVLSNRFVEDEFRFLLDITRRARRMPQRAAAKLYHEEVNIHFESVSTFLGQLRQPSTSKQEALTIVRQILHELQESPDDDEIERRIRKFIETKVW